MTIMFTNYQSMYNRRDHQLIELGNSWRSFGDSLIISFTYYSRLWASLIFILPSLLAVICITRRISPRWTFPVRLTALPYDQNDFAQINHINRTRSIDQSTTFNNSNTFIATPKFTSPQNKTFTRNILSYSDNANWNWSMRWITQFYPKWWLPKMIPTIRSSLSTSEDILPDIRLQRGPIAADSPIRLQYAALARQYLLPFRRIGGIKRASYLNPFLHHRHICGGCFLVQVRNSAIYVYDPLGVGTSMAEFRRMRMREAIEWIKFAVRRGVITEFEGVFSTTDGVATTSRSHKYQMPPPQYPSPVFSLVHCNVSDNLPFPMMLTDVLRRGMSDKYWNQTNPTLDEWDSDVVDSGKIDGQLVPWHDKKTAAVFRGRIRDPAIMRNTSQLSESQCNSTGRSGLWARAMQHEEEVKEEARQEARRRRIWPFPENWFERDITPLLDVMVEGTCGSRVYVTDHLPLEKQNSYKYIIHAEGNSFWADRLTLLLFSSNAIVKQSVPCGMFFEPLLVPYEHYIPVDFEFKYLVKRVRWASRNDERVLYIIRQARKFAGEFLSRTAVQTYVDELLKQYSDLLIDKNFQIRPGALKVYP